MNPCRIEDLKHSTSEAMAGSTAWLGRGLSCVCAQGSDIDARPSFDLTPVQEKCLQILQNRIDLAYDSAISEHQVKIYILTVHLHMCLSLFYQNEALRALWKAAFPVEELHGLISEQWKEMGWQGKDPSSDFRYISIFSPSLPPRHPKNKKTLMDLLQKQEGDRALWEYPFAVTGVNITFMLIQMLDLEAMKPRNLVGATFLKFLAENESAFDLLYCITFKLMDQQWLAMHASYIDFNTVMKSTRRQIERELLQSNIKQLEDLQSYRLLNQ
ncbi:hypothetical protein K7X08_023116 [Anisodus acutangulus]|uniref:ELMO domain-containing protein n=1 Tax=Anisodus acutangulus TaxID=402998 RepID=A0A9Q1MH03_9SOLA|nr:hypothetical protein K7X08_023116 [Anisodus acutangulus]